MNNYFSLLRALLHMILKSSWCLEVHSNSWLSDLKVGKATEILQEEQTEFMVKDKQEY